MAKNPIDGTNAAEDLVGTPGGDRIDALGGNDTLVGRGGRDVLLGGAGADELNGGAVADVFEFSSLGGAGTMRDFTPGVDKVDLSGYASADSSITWAAIQTWFEAGDTGVRIRLDSDRFKNQLFEFTGLTSSDLSESDFIL
ncbi:MAG: M10 family metallopeptidase C-terminal domain-containing protein [Arenibacterium sp.]